MMDMNMFYGLLLHAALLFMNARTARPCLLKDSLTFQLTIHTGLGPFGMECVSDAQCADAKRSCLSWSGAVG